MSPLGSSWITSAIIWIVFIILLAIYNKQFIKQIRMRSPIVLASQHAGSLPIQRDEHLRGISDPKRLASVNDTLGALIKWGEELAHRMQSDDFHRGQLGQEVHQWLDNTEHDVWEVVPEHASQLKSNQTTTKEVFTAQEMLQYGYWNRDAASIRVSVDRRLQSLREIHSQIRVVDKEGSQTE